MGSLYIGGAQCMHAVFLEKGHWENFDAGHQALREMAENDNLYVNRESLSDQGKWAFVIMNQRPNTECFYDGAAFGYDMTIPVSADFEERARRFIAQLEACPDFAVFHGMSWSSPQNLYFVTS